jgi:hypothetical protein
MPQRKWALVILLSLALAACGSTGDTPSAAPTITILDERLPVSQISRRGEWAYFTIIYSDAAHTTHRYFASCSQAAYSGMEYAAYHDPRIAFEPADSVLFRALCG